MTQSFLWYPLGIHVAINWHRAQWYSSDVPLTSDRWKPYKNFTIKGTAATVWRANEGGLWLYTATMDSAAGPVNPCLCEGKLSMREAISALERKQGTKQ
jgi:hypothetical protein